MGSLKARFEVNKDTVALVYLAEIYRMDLMSLLLLYEKYDKDVFFFFYLLAGRQVTFTKVTKFQRILLSSLDLIDKLEEGSDEEPKTEQEKQVFARLKEYYNAEDQVFEITYPLVNDATGAIDIGPPFSSRVSNKSTPET